MTANITLINAKTTSQTLKMNKYSTLYLIDNKISITISKFEA